MTKRNILSFEEAQQALTPYYDKLANAVLEGFNDYLKVHNCAAERIGFVEYEIRTKANLVHDHIKIRIKEAFFDVSEVETGKWKGIFAVKINDDLFIRFKKLNDDYSASNFQTNQTKNFLNQLALEGFPEEPTFLFAGYQPDKTWTGIKGIYIACWEGDQIQWVEEILSKVSLVQTALPFYDQEPTEKRVKLKNQNQPETKTGTND
jgi:hypothetical protein